MRKQIAQPLSAAIALVLACEDHPEPFAPEAPSPASTAALPPTRPSLAARAAANLRYPINDSINDSATALTLHQTGLGGAGAFLVENSNSTAIALLGEMHGRGAAVRGVATGPSGRAGVFEVLNPSGGELALNAKHNGPGSALLAQNTSSGRALHAWNTGSGPAGLFELSQSSNGNPALEARTNGVGPGIRGVNTGAGFAGLFEITNSASAIPALEVRQLGSGQAVRATGLGGTAVQGLNNGRGRAASFHIGNSINTQSALFAETSGSGWAGEFRGASNGVRIATNLGGAALQVVGGSKNAVVGTTTGARALYSEESSEVWFSDYGFARLEQGRARVLIDPLFAQAINPQEPYHVFVQPYGDAELYVTERSPLGFVVRLRAGDGSVEFSYRLVAKRRGFERARLERAPWMDEVLYEEK